MIYLNTFLYYTLFSSVVLIYGIGLNKTIEIGITKFTSLIYYLKSVFSIFTTSILSWLFTKYILVPINLIELFPLICLLIFICISTFLDTLVRITTGTTAPEFMISFFIILISIFESTSILYTMIICFSSFVAFLIMVPFGITFKKRVCSNGNFLDEKYYSIFFMFLAILILLISVFDINWLQSGVIK